MGHKVRHAVRVRRDWRVSALSRGWMSGAEGKCVKCVMFVCVWQCLSADDKNWCVRLGVSAHVCDLVTVCVCVCVCV